MEAMGLAARVGDRPARGRRGGRRGGRRPTRFEAGFGRLSEAARRRLVIENDDRTYSLADVLPLARRLGVPVVWDILHHHCHDPEGIPDREALELALATWPRRCAPEDPLLLSAPRHDRAQEEGGSPGRAQAGAARPAQPRRPGRSAGLRGVPAQHRRRPGVRHDAGGQGQGPGRAAAARPARGAATSMLDAAGWIDERLAEAGLRRTGEVEEHGSGRGRRCCARRPTAGTSG